MEAKLIKKDNGYYMTHKSSGWYIGDTDHEKVKNFKGEQGLLKLSLKNCQEIENGYDLDDLADKYEYVNYKGKSKSYNIGFKHGFQKALEIIGDKKFTYNQMVSAITESSISHRLPSLIIQDLQQTEWDVEIMMEGFVDDEGIYCGEKPLLDADGCLILKRK